MCSDMPRQSRLDVITLAIEPFAGRTAWHALPLPPRPSVHTSLPVAADWAEGTRRSERKRARQYLKWLLKQRGGTVFVEDVAVILSPSLPPPTVALLCRSRSHSPALWKCNSAYLRWTTGWVSAHILSSRGPSLATAVTLCATSHSPWRLGSCKSCMASTVLPCSTARTKSPPHAPCRF